MKICVVGAGAIGGLLAVRLAEAGEQVTVVDQGAHLEAIQRAGLKLVMADGSEHVARSLEATADMRDPGPQDVVIIAVKTHSLAEVASGLVSLMGNDTVIVPMQNGLPWWYFHKHGGEHDGRSIECLDPDGRLAAHVDVDRVIGCVVYPAGEIASPGVVRHTEGNRFPLGELDGSDSARAHELADMFIRAGFKSFVLDDIRGEIWLKLLGNLSFNPISALTHATLVDICRYAPSRALAVTMMEEAQAVANHLGITLRVSIEKRVEGAERVGKHKTSMLQDVEAGRRLELEAIMGAVVELARVTGIATPAIDAIYALTKLLDETMREDHGALQLRRIA
ncbi:MAG: 2-dehydropantoate 2-reductase [Gammaproteobacteria bacterium]|nr:2-dehydropantoate 2-reductase [Gammaproteobacteria bacterium]NIM72981.1 2-dehydropantoate 2-reductase [Gammaproteobacteria bacterium]NIN38597.1 2-dehydropantoate 2-reductase [Gammaproteobacteria bacterium]NIO24733.1 2-dehydropantoate 2-reductase [Gammaproteobacteria bacterium]NIO65336.1 2-dehydropantoate 2-reductase [Gammaproteobacteria bacterium]